MYTRQDMVEIGLRIRRYCLIFIPLMLVWLAGYVASMIVRTQAGAMASAVLLVATVCFAFGMYLYPCIRYRRFLGDMEEGLSREMAGTIVEISDKEDLQDGVRVLPVRILLEDEDDERIVYLNASKAEGFPAPGTKVRLNCFGRHIKEVDVV